LFDGAAPNEAACDDAAVKGLKKLKKTLTEDSADAQIDEKEEDDEDGDEVCRFSRWNCPVLLRLFFVRAPAPPSLLFGARGFDRNKSELDDACAACNGRELDDSSAAGGPPSNIKSTRTP
jgi:hypothetical protein